MMLTLFSNTKKTQPHLKIFFTFLKILSKPSHLWVKLYFSKPIKFYKKKCRFFGKTSDKILTFFCVKIYVVFEKVISPIVQKCSQNKTWTFSQKITKGSGDSEFHGPGNHELAFKSWILSLMIKWRYESINLLNWSHLKQ